MNYSLASYCFYNNNVGLFILLSMDHISLTMYNYVYEVLVWLEGQQRDQAAIMPSTILRQTLPGLRHEHQTWPMLWDIHPL